MSIPLITERKIVRVESYEWWFERKGEPSSGFYFPCDKDGNLLESTKQNEDMMHNWQYCNNLLNQFEKPIIRKYSNKYTEEATAQCHCGHIIPLWDEYLGACECPHCHQWYNMFGQEVSNPEKWSQGDDWDCDY